MDGGRTKAVLRSGRSNRTWDSQQGMSYKRHQEATWDEGTIHKHVSPQPWFAQGTVDQTHSKGRSSYSHVGGMSSRSLCLVSYPKVQEEN